MCTQGRFSASRCLAASAVAWALVLASAIEHVGANDDLEGNETDFNETVLIIATPVPTLLPTFAPTVALTVAPTEVAPTSSPTKVPTATPTQVRSAKPTGTPSVAPSSAPTPAPSAGAGPLPPPVDLAETGHIVAFHLPLSSELSADELMNDTDFMSALEVAGKKIVGGPNASALGDVIVELSDARRLREFLAPPRRLGMVIADYQFNLTAREAVEAVKHRVTDLSDAKAIFASEMAAASGQSGSQYDVEIDEASLAEAFRELEAELARVPDLVDVPNAATPQPTSSPTASPDSLVQTNSSAPTLAPTSAAPVQSAAPTKSPTNPPTNSPTPSVTNTTNGLQNRTRESAAIDKASHLAPVARWLATATVAVSIAVALVA
mmetsp:Transcript_69318/g.192996  ORF Transcript_69318/g.192996 Transcript_69318/m.192996 type:complete len:379 (-) Transcript_69318:192-1328(-)